MLAQHFHSLIAVEISERDVRKKVAAKIGLGYRGGMRGSAPCLSQLDDHIGRIGSFPYGENGFPNIKSDAFGNLPALKQLALSWRTGPS